MSEETQGEDQQAAPKPVEAEVIDSAAASETTPKPGFVTAIGGIRLGAGCVNILCGLTLFWLIYPLLLIPLGIIEIINGAALLAARPKEVKWVYTLAILEIVAVVAFSVLSLASGIVILVFLQRDEVKKYFAGLGYSY